MESRITHWASVAEIVSSLAVVVSLVFLVIEVNRNTEATIGDTSQQLLNLLQQADSWLADAAFADVFVRARDVDATVNAAEREQYATYVKLKWDACELAFDRRQAELVSDDYWDAWEGGCKAMLEPYLAREIWRERRTWFGPGFRAYYDGVASTFE